eukprot:c30820_g1_i1 orf=397-2262(-)
MASSDFRSSTLPNKCEDDMLEQMLVPSCERSESANFSDESLLQDSALTGRRLKKRWRNLGRRVACAVNAFKQALAQASLSNASSKESYRKAVWSGVLQSLTERYPGSQLPEKLITTLRSHLDSLPISYSQAGFDIEEVFHHVRLLEQVEIEGHCEPLVLVQELCETGRSSNASDLSTSSSFCTSYFSDDEECDSIRTFKLAFACKSMMSRSSISSALENADIAVKQLRLFEKKCTTLGVAIVRCSGETSQPHKLQAIIQASIRKSKGPRLSLGLRINEIPGTAVSTSLLSCRSDKIEPRKFCAVSLQNSCNEVMEPILDFCLDKSSNTSGIRSSGGYHQPTNNPNELLHGKTLVQSCLLESSKLQISENVLLGSYGIVCEGFYGGELVVVKKLGRVSDMELRQDILGLIVSCRHESILPLRGICLDSQHSMCLVMKYMEGGSLLQLIQKRKLIPLSDVLSIAIDIAEGMVFLHKRGIVHRDLKSSAILLDGRMRAVIGDLDVVNIPRTDAGVIESGGHRWVAPEVLGSDPESLIITFMNNVYSFGIIVWEMLNCHMPYMHYTPVQNARVPSFAAFHPVIPNDCPLQLKCLLESCWATCPIDRPNFFEVLELLHKAAMELSL